MTLTKELSFEVKAGDLLFSFLNSGDIFQTTHQHIMINQWVSNPVDGSLNNLYLRFFRSAGIQVFPLLGAQSKSEVEYSGNHVAWKGNIDEVHYQVIFHLTEQGIWFWDITVDGHDVEVDVVYGQDLGMASKGAVRNNEAYVSQYIDHKVFEDERKGYVVCSRQNQKQPGGFPYLQQGSLTKAVGYSTDGFQFFGLTYKETNQPEVLYKDSLPNEVYQYEFAYTGLQSERVTLAGPVKFVFYGLFKEDHPSAVTSLEYGEDVEIAWEEVNNHKEYSAQSLEKVSRTSKFGTPLVTDSMTKDEISKLYPDRHQEEWEGDTLLSFFTGTYEHVVLKEKERLVERPHGHILMTGQNDKIKENVLSSTSFMYGIFNSQLVVGNTSFNKLLTNARNALNVMKTSGQRIYVEIDGVYHLLTMPSLFEMGFNYTRWFYKTSDETFIITNFSMVDSPEIHLSVRTESGNAYRYLLTNQVSMNGNELEVPFHYEREGQTVSFTADADSNSAAIYPDLKYRIRIEGTEFTLDNESKLISNAEPHSASVVVFELKPAEKWEMTMQGLLHGEEYPFAKRDAPTEIERYRDYFRQVMNGFHLSHQGETVEELDKVNALAWWYTHNMLVHFSVPHGLEQYSGAAWGTRDVCQGPMEYFMAVQKYETVKEIIKTVYTHQFEDDGNWPQWFMFDKYSHIQAGESHGDIIVWPLKVLGDYLAVTKDYDILQEKVPYTKRGNGFKLTDEVETIYEHAKKEINYIKEHFLHDTHLSSYGDGDWDDTLQPANAKLKQFMVSSWTVALTYQALRNLSVVLEEVDGKEASDLAQLASGIEADFNRYMLKSGVIPGFVYMENPDTAELMLHPEDEKTGIQYRLLPMQRSIISELLTKEQAEDHYELIKETLNCPDGVRLMNRPANYQGGISTHFQRAETASNFGREIGLQYVHAHIRFVEAMAKLGKVEEVWSGLAKINPIRIQDVVPNAERRQSNAYFSSSDGKFNTRYEAQDYFGKLKDGTVPVKGGWRIYSSGPGIYMNQLISNCLGIRPAADELVIDPVLPVNFDRLTFNFMLYDKSVSIVYYLGTGETGPRVVINGESVKAIKTIKNRYRQGGLCISKVELESKLNSETNIIEVYL
jgi:1,2-beta-oligoglucan phosphorylase